MMKSIRFRIASILLAIIVLLSVSFGTISTLVIKSGADEIFWIIILTVVYCLVVLWFPFGLGVKLQNRFRFVRIAYMRCRRAT